MSQNEKVAIYAGSFDPLTNGHLDIIERASGLFDKLIVVAAKNSSKNPLFTLEERMDMIREATEHIGNVEVQTISGLLVDTVEKYQAVAVVRGLRTVSDFDYETAMAMMNRQLNKRCETVFLMPDPELSFVSSKIIREIASYEGDITRFVPAFIAEKVDERIAKKK